MDDLISRQAAIDALIAEYKEKTETYWDNGLDMHDVESVLMALPSIAPVKHGKWMPRIATGNIALIECSECKFHYPEVLGTFSFYYCPYCGAKMDKGDDE